MSRLKKPSAISFAALLALSGCDSGHSPVEPSNLTPLTVQTLVTSVEAGRRPGHHTRRACRPDRAEDRASRSAAIQTW